VNVLDEHILEDQRQLLRSWRIPVRQIGPDIGRKGMKDPEIISLVLALRRLKGSLNLSTQNVAPVPREAARLTASAMASGVILPCHSSIMVSHASPSTTCSSTSATKMRVPRAVFRLRSGESAPLQILWGVRISPCRPNPTSCQFSVISCQFPTPNLQHPAPSTQHPRSRSVFPEGY